MFASVGRGAGVAGFRHVRPRRGCREPSCGATFRAYKMDQAFCSARCARAWHNRKKARALALYDLAYAWRKDRRLIGDMAQMVRLWWEEDEAMKRQRPADSDQPSAPNRPLNPES